MIRAGDTFRSHLGELEYLDHPYNTTALNERAFEVPLARAWLERRPAGGVEVGNVLSHYGPVTHRVVDRHEHAPGVENIDATELTGTYPWVLAISTLEHIGRDMGEAVDPHAAERALEHLLGCLEPGGSMLATIPRAQHAGLDYAIGDEGLGADRESTWWYHPDGWTEHVGSRHWGPSRECAWPTAVWVGEWDR
jgi:hypothetical protein